MVDAQDLKSWVRKDVRVQVPLRVQGRQEDLSAFFLCISEFEVAGDGGEDGVDMLEHVRGEQRDIVGGQECFL